MDDAQAAADDAARKAQTLAEQAAQRADAGINQASTLAAQAAEALRGSSEKTQHATEAAADGLERASEYMHDADSSTVMHDAVRFVKKHPIQTVAAIVGAYVVARFVF
jgi:ElaB/YqjD/DUF883 family membrane-anchored ribosome-binding protein